MTMAYKAQNGSILATLEAARDVWCAEHNCEACPLEENKNGLGIVCDEFVKMRPAESARLLGYEVIKSDTNQDAKADKGKPRPSLVPPALIDGVMQTREFGTARYGGPENWRGVEPHRYWDALLRHVLAAWNDWKAIDPESGMPHLWHAATNAAFLMQFLSEENNG